MLKRENEELGISDTYDSAYETAIFLDTPRGRCNKTKENIKGQTFEVEMEALLALSKFIAS